MNIKTIFKNSLKTGKKTLEVSFNDITVKLTLDDISEKDNISKIDNVYLELLSSSFNFKNVYEMFDFYVNTAGSTKELNFSRNLISLQQFYAFDTIINQSHPLSSIVDKYELYDILYKNIEEFFHIRKLFKPEFFRVNKLIYLTLKKMNNNNYINNFNFKKYINGYYDVDIKNYMIHKIKCINSEGIIYDNDFKNNWNKVLNSFDTEYLISDKNTFINLSEKKLVYL